MHARLVMVVLVGLSLAASGCRGPRKRALTKEQERRVAAAMLSERPTPQVPIGALFDGKLRLIGLDVDDAEVRPGDTVTITWYWESVAEAPGAWKLFVHLEGPGRREPFDHDPVGELLPIKNLKPGQIIKDVQQIRVSSEFPTGVAKVWTGIFDAEALSNRKQDVRMAITNAAELQVPHDQSQRVLALELKVSKTASAKKPDEDAKPPRRPAADRRPRRYSAYRAPGPIIVDGRLDDPGWQGIARLTDFVVPQDGAALSAARRPDARITFDDEFLYVAFYNPDPDIRSEYEGRDSELWKADVVEIYLDPGSDGRDYLELQVAPTGEIFDARFSSWRDPPWEEAAPAFTIDMNAKVSIDGTLNDDGRDRSWTVEVAIPFAQIPGAGKVPDNGTSWSVNLYRLDQRFHAAWAPVGSDYHKLSDFGRVTFVASAPPGGALPAPAPEDKRRILRRPQPESNP